MLFYSGQQEDQFMLKIVKYLKMTENELVSQLKKTRLRGFGSPLVYERAHIEIEESVFIPTLVPPQRYVLNGRINDILSLHDAFLKHGENIFELRGALLFWLEGMNPFTDPPIPFLPPIAEQSVEKNGQRVMLVNDGMHRVMSALRLGDRINTVYVKNVPAEYPYYAYGFMGGWDNVKCFDELPDEFQKKDYRNPENYKALFRDFNALFPGVQEQRKQSNPAHIKE